MERSENSLKKITTVVEGSLLFRLASWGLVNIVVIPLLWLVGFLVYRLRVKGRKNLRGHRKGIIVANHCQYLEPGLSARVLWPKKIFFGTEEQNLRRKDVGWFLPFLRVFAIPDRHPLSMAGLIKRALAKRYFVFLYPEGIIHWRSQKLGSFLDGAFFFAFLHDVPVFPFTEVLRDRPLRKIFPWWPPQTTFVIGEPLNAKEFRKEDFPRRQRIHRMAQRVREVMEETIEREGGCQTLWEACDP